MSAPASWYGSGCKSTPIDNAEDGRVHPDTEAEGNHEGSSVVRLLFRLRNTYLTSATILDMPFPLLAFLNCPSEPNPSKDPPDDQATTHLRGLTHLRSRSRLAVMTSTYLRLMAHYRDRSTSGTGG